MQASSPADWIPKTPQEWGREEGEREIEAESWKAWRHSITLCAITLSSHILLSEVVSLLRTIFF